MPKLLKTLYAMSMAAAVTMFAQAQAANLTWDANTGSSGIQDGSGNWVDGGNNWDSGGVNVNWNNATPDTAIIGAAAGAAGTITLTGPITVDDLTFNAASSSNYTVTGDTLTLAGAGTPTITTNTNATINSQLSGSLGFTKQGNNVLTLGGTNNYTGTTLVSAGVINIRNNDALGSNANGSQVNNGTALQLQNNITVTGETLLLRGQGLTGDGNTGALRSISGNNTWTGNITADFASPVVNASPTDVTRIASDSGHLIVSGNISIAAGIVTNAVSVGVQGNGTGEISGNITGGTAGMQGFFRSGAGTGMWTISGTNTYLGFTAVNGPLTITGGAAIPNTSLVGINNTTGALTVGTSETIGSLISGNGHTASTVSLGSNTLTVGSDNSTPTDPFNNGANGAYWGSINGVGGNLTKIGTGTMRLAGNVGNTYTGLTTVSGGRLDLDKSVGNAISGNLLINGGRVSYGNGGTARSNQIADGATITMTGSASEFNLTNQNNLGISETIANLNVSGGLFASGALSNWNITGTGTFTGGVDNPKYVAQSGSNQTFNSLSLVGMNALTGEANPGNSFAVFGNSTAAQTTLTVGSGGLSLNGSNMYIRKGVAASTLGSRLVLNGNVSTAGTSASNISHDPLGIGLTVGNIAVQLSGTAPAVNRTFNIAGGGADLAISVPVTNGASSAGGIIKTGLGKLTLTGVNTYTGNTLVSAGTLGGTGAVGSDFTIASGGTLSPGASAGTLLTDDLTLQAGSITLIEIGGLTPGTQHDQILSSGTATLGGTLIVNVINGFNPDESDSFTILSALSVVGEFDSVVTLGAGGGFQAIYVGNEVLLTNFQLVPEPSTVTLLGLASVGLMAVRRRRLRKQTIAQQA